jgi:hypothetical protein
MISQPSNKFTGQESNRQIVELIDWNVTKAADISANSAKFKEEF